MNISFPKAVPHFGAVFKKDPGTEESLYFQHDAAQKGMAQSFYATGEDKVVLSPLTDTINNASEKYYEAKNTFYINSGRYDEDTLSTILSAYSNIQKNEHNAKRRENDAKMIQRYASTEGHAAFVAARNTYEAAVDQYLAKTAELAQKAQ